MNSPFQQYYVEGQQDMANAMRDWLDAQDPDGTEAREEVIRYARLVCSWLPEVYLKPGQPVAAIQELQNLRKAVGRYDGLEGTATPAGHALTAPRSLERYASGGTHAASFLPKQLARTALHYLARVEELQRERDEETAAHGQTLEDLHDAEAQVAKLREALQAMWDQFSYDGGTGGLSALELADDALVSSPAEGAEA
jgi:hypothetical protein